MSSNEHFSYTYKVINGLIKNPIFPGKYICIKKQRYEYNNITYLVTFSFPSSENNKGKPKVRIFLILHEDVIVNAKKVNQYLSYLCKVWITVKPDTFSVATKRSNGLINYQVNVEFLFVFLECNK